MRMFEPSFRKPVSLVCGLCDGFGDGDRFPLVATVPLGKVDIAGHPRQEIWTEELCPIRHAFQLAHQGDELIG